MDTQQLLYNSGHEVLLELQEKTIEAFSEHSHLSVIARTGSGKTLAFLLAASNYLNPEANHVQQLIIVPTRELAIQVTDVFKSLGTGMKVTVCYGGHNSQDERNSLEQTPAIVIGTPGRLLDHLERDHLDISKCGTVIIDEFDKSLEFGFEKDMAKIRTFLPQKIRSIYVSATRMDRLPNEWETKLFPIDFGTDSTESKLTEWAVDSSDDSFEALYKCLCSFQSEQSIVFCNYREVVDDVVNRLRAAEIHCEAYHGGLNQSERERSLIKFANGSTHTLVCTDLGSRGLDIENIRHVVHYQFPGSEAAYIHRNGRTARASKSGNAYLIAGESQQLPEYVTLPEKTYTPKEMPPPPHPEWLSLYVAAGKKDKIRKMDIVGFLTKQGKLPGAAIGKIDLMDRMAFVAIKRRGSNAVFKNIKDEKLKGKKVLIKKAK